MDEKVIYERIEWKGDHPPPRMEWPGDRTTFLTDATEGVDSASDANEAANANADEMAEPTREEFDAKLAAAEARTQTLFAQIDGKIDRLSDAILQLRGEVAESRQDVADSRREWHQEANSIRWWLVGAVISIFIGVSAIVVGMMSYGLSAIDLGRVLQSEAGRSATGND